MKQLYLILDIAVILFPLLLSFDKKVNYVQRWYYVFIALIVVGLPFLIHDYFFTEMGVWGFNSMYLTEYYVLNLPIEEVLFFVVVPFACVFIYECCSHYFQRFSFEKFNQGFYIFLFCYAVLILGFGWGRCYSSMVSIVVIVVLTWIFTRKEKYNYLPIAFVLSMLPFFLMNGILTGGMTTEPIVWYDNSQNIETRWWTIPAEDILYSFLLIAGNIFVFDYFAKRGQRIET